MIDAAVRVSGDGPSGRLIGFIVLKSGSRLDTAALKTYALSRLPEFTVPGTFAVVDRIPLNTNGKVDRAALRTLAPTSERSDSHRAPQTDTEVRMAAIWSRLLNISAPSLNDNFFEKGGQSLLATPMVNEISCEFGITLTLRQLFENPRLEALVRLVDCAERTGVQPPALSVETASPVALLGMLDHLTDEEVDRALARLAVKQGFCRIGTESPAKA